jgi:hypothetical protein
VSCIVDHVALYRGVGSAEIMAAQMRHMLKVASLPDVTMQLLPAVTDDSPKSGAEMLPGAWPGIMRPRTRYDQ